MIYQKALRQRCISSAQVPFSATVRASARSLLAAGLVCGFLWEFFNYWAISKWTYTVPYLGNVKIFEMPVLGFLGFPPFAVECWVIYIFVRSLLPPAVRETESAEIIVRAA